MTKLPYKIRMVLGDPKNDGHGIVESNVIFSNLSFDELTAAYADGSLKIGFDFISSICAEYQDMELPDSELTILESAGLLDWLNKNSRGKHNNSLTEFFFDKDADINRLTTTKYILVWLFIAWLGNSLLEFELDGELPSIHIGGYGLFL